MSLRAGGYVSHAEGQKLFEQRGVVKLSGDSVLVAWF